MRNIRQNLFFAFIYIVLGVPVAAGVYSHFLVVVIAHDYGGGHEFQFTFRSIEHA